MLTLRKTRVGTGFVLVCGFLASTLFVDPSKAQQTPVRVTTVVDDAERSTILGTRPPMAKTEFESGGVPSGTRLQGVKITFRKTPAQQAELEALISAQQDPASPLYHQSDAVTPHQSSTGSGPRQVRVQQAGKDPEITRLAQSND